MEGIILIFVSLPTALDSGFVLWEVFLGIQYKPTGRARAQMVLQHIAFYTIANAGWSEVRGLHTNMYIRYFLTQ